MTPIAQAVSLRQGATAPLLGGTIRPNLLSFGYRLIWQRELYKIWLKLAMTISRSTPESNAESSLEATQVFCQLMLKASLIAIPAYLGLFIIAVPFDANAGATKALVLTTPVLAFIVAAVIYSVDFLTPILDSDRETPDGLSRIKRRVLRRKMTLILSGSAIFLIGVCSSTLLLLKARL